MEELKKVLKTNWKYLKILETNNITTIKDFLQYFPRAYEDRGVIKSIWDLHTDGKLTMTTKAQIIEKKVLPRGKRKIYEVTIQDQYGLKAYLSYFNTYYLVKQLKKDKRYIITGKPKFQYGKIIFHHPETSPTETPEQTDIEDKTSYNFGRIYPIYPELQNIKPGRFAKKMWSLTKLIKENFEEYLPKEFIKKFTLTQIPTTIKNMHYPKNFDDQQKALERIFFDRLLRVQLISLMNKQQYQKGKKIPEKTICREIVKKFLNHLPFELTQAQKKVTKTIIENLHEPKPMIRLLQWDVGSGKTIVATIAAYYKYKKFWWQSVFLAPLEVLANQHYQTLAKLLLPLGLRVELLKWSMTKGQKNKIKSDLKQGKIHVIVGTHALIQDDVKFHNLQLAIVDEQHKFGVKQRAFFKKFNSPHILQMSATPIPRSMALAFFGEFDVSIIDEMPIGRKPIHTKIISENERKKLKPRVMTKIKQKQKVFIITPLIEESEKLENVKAALTEFEEIKKLYPELKDQIWLLHGKIKPKEKEKIMDDFKKKKINILVSTTVVEVGIDIPEATIMIIKNAERFGLSQLHQLRGRIGRSNIQSYCFLETKSKSSESYKRLKAMEQNTDGFKLAELDLQHRGAGEILWVRQSGETDIPIEILSNIKFLEEVKEWALWLLNKHPNLEGIPKLKKYLDKKIDDVLA